MRAILIHNPKAGHATSAAELECRLGEIGWDVVRCVERGELDDFDPSAADVVVAAGGDGTISKVAKRLSRANVPLAIVPLGTANNVARGLGIGLDSDLAISGLRAADERRVDLGTITGTKTPPGDPSFFLEGFGMGVFAEVIAEQKLAAKTKLETLEAATEVVADRIARSVAQRWEITVDGKDISGSYVLVAVMNLTSIGPALRLAPDARCDDGALDVVLVRPDARALLQRHTRPSSETLPGFETVRGRSIRVRSQGGFTHADDRPQKLDGEIAIDVAAGAVRVLVPRLAEPGQ